jgi:hypothetical protein
MYVNAKMIPLETVLGIGGGGADEFKYDIFDTLQEPL